MRIVNLVENTLGRADCAPAHGLSLYIETARHRLLMDAGPSPALLSGNAKALGVDLSAVDIAVLSHGHYDHADGLTAFAALNPRAPICLRRGAMGDFWSDSGGAPHYIGVSDAVKALNRFTWVDGADEIAEGVWLFGDVRGRRLWPAGNASLCRRVGGARVPDDFSHEQCLVVEDGGRRALLSGCAHSGILNLLERYRQLFDGAPDVVISGFHMKKSTPYTPEETEDIRATARELSGWPCAFYTCHCTGMPAYALMRETMGEQLRYLRCGDAIVV